MSCDQHSTSFLSPLIAAAVVMTTMTLAASPGTCQAPAPSAGTPAITFDITVLDRDGRVPADLRPSDLSVTVDGRPRPVLWLRRVSRGPGAVTDAASRQARTSAAVSATVFAAEPSRVVLVVVDVASLARGDERAAIAAGNMFLDRLGMGDRVAVAHVPFAATASLALSTDRPSTRELLSQVRGQGSRTESTVDAMIAEQQRTRTETTDPDRERTGEAEAAAQAERERQERLAAMNRAGDPAGLDRPPGLDSLSGLAGLIEALSAVPGRKIVAFFSAGLPAGSSPRVDEVAAAAVAARAVIHVFGLRTSLNDERSEFDAGSLQRLARITGGASIVLGSKPERAIERLAGELSACYTVGVEADDAKGSAVKGSVRIDTRQRDVTVRGPQFWSASAPDSGDLIAGSGGAADPAAATAALAPAGAIEGIRYIGGGVALADPRPAPAVRSAELDLALARLWDYADAYERQYSMLVAEEDYRQSLPRRSIRLRSDFLLVRLDAIKGWVSFRDVFEVDGAPVRDRDDRLKQLFLKPNPEAQMQLAAIKDESTRYNIGPIDRNINVPLFPLKFLIPINRDRLKYRLAGTPEAEGVRTWRVEFQDDMHPTIVSDRQGNDIATHGWFLVDQMTGAVVESAVAVDERGYMASMVVRYRRDDTLGMWVPAEMRESYSGALERSIAPTLGMRDVGPPASSIAQRESLLEGVAKYSKFRRFQVKTEETMSVPK